MTVVTVAVVTVVIVTYFSKNNLTPRQPLMLSVQLFAILAMFLVSVLLSILVERFFVSRMRDFFYYQDISLGVCKGVDITQG